MLNIIRIDCVCVQKKIQTNATYRSLDRILQKNQSIFYAIYFMLRIFSINFKFIIIIIDIYFFLDIGVEENLRNMYFS